VEWRKEGFTISDERAKVKIDTIAHLLAETHWGYRRPRPVVEKLVENSLCFSLFRNNEQIGFARVVTDQTVFSWLSDLVIAPELRGRGLGRWLLQCILNHPAISGAQFVLQTRDAHHFYESFGFQRSDKLMTRPGSIPKPPEPPESVHPDTSL
jgi:GNAT superfamily N-acetyltransferase